MKVEHDGQYAYTIREAIEGRPAKVLADRPCDDPFIHSTIRPAGWRVALAVLLGRYEVHVHVTGTEAAHRVVFGSDYADTAVRVDLKVDAGEFTASLAKSAKPTWWGK